MDRDAQGRRRHQLPGRMPVSREAVGIAEERYARGEITAEELSRIRAHLSAG